MLAVPDRSLNTAFKLYAEICYDRSKKKKKNAKTRFPKRLEIISHWLREIGSETVRSRSILNCSRLYGYIAHNPVVYKNEVDVNY